MSSLRLGMSLMGGTAGGGELGVPTWYPIAGQFTFYTGTLPKVIRMSQYVKYHPSQPILSYASTPSGINTATGDLTFPEGTNEGEISYSVTATNTAGTSASITVNVEIIEGAGISKPVWQNPGMKMSARDELPADTWDMTSYVTDGFSGPLFNWTVIPPQDAYFSFPNDDGILVATGTSGIPGVGENNIQMSVSNSLGSSTSPVPGASWTVLPADMSQYYHLFNSGSVGAFSFSRSATETGKDYLARDQTSPANVGVFPGCQFDGSSAWTDKDGVGYGLQVTGVDTVINAPLSALTPLSSSLANDFTFQCIAYWQQAPITTNGDTLTFFTLHSSDMDSRIGVNTGLDNGGNDTTFVSVVPSGGGSPSYAVAVPYQLQPGDWVDIRVRKRSGEETVLGDGLMAWMYVNGILIGGKPYLALDNGVPTDASGDLTPLTMCDLSMTNSSNDLRDPADRIIYGVRITNREDSDETETDETITGWPIITEPTPVFVEMTPPDSLDFPIYVPVEPPEPTGDLDWVDKNWGDQYELQKSVGQPMTLIMDVVNETSVTFQYKRLYTETSPPVTYQDAGVILQWEPLTDQITGASISTSTIPGGDEGTRYTLNIPNQTWTDDEAEKEDGWILFTAYGTVGGVETSIRVNFGDGYRFRPLRPATFPDWTGFGGLYALWSLQEIEPDGTEINLSWSRPNTWPWEDQYIDKCVYDNDPAGDFHLIEVHALEGDGGSLVPNGSDPLGANGWQYNNGHYIFHRKAAYTRKAAPPAGNNNSVGLRHTYPSAQNTSSGMTVVLPDFRFWADDVGTAIHLVDSADGNFIKVHTTGGTYHLTAGGVDHDTGSPVLASDVTLLILEINNSNINLTVMDMVTSVVPAAFSTPNLLGNTDIKSVTFCANGDDAATNTIGGLYSMSAVFHEAGKDPVDIFDMSIQKLWYFGARYKGIRNTKS